MTGDFRRAWTASFSVGMALRSRTTRPRKTWPVAVRYRPQSPGQRRSGVREIGPAKFPGCLFFEFMKARERRRAALSTSATRAPSNWVESEGALDSLFDRIFCGKPVSTFPENALGFRGSPPFRINDSVRVGSLSKNARLLHRSSSLGTLRHRAGLIERRLRFCVQIKFWPLVFSHGEKTTSRGVTLSVRSSTLRIREVATIISFDLVPGAEPRGMTLREVIR